MMAFIGGFSLFEFSKMNRAAIGFTDSILPAVVRTSTLGETINALRRYELDVFLVADDAQQKARYRNESEKSLQEAARQIVAHDGTIWAEDREERRAFDIVKADWSDLSPCTSASGRCRTRDRWPKPGTSSWGRGSPSTPP